MSKKEYKIMETSTDTRHFYIETNDSLSDQDVNEAVGCAGLNDYDRCKFTTESGAKGWISYEATDYGDDSQIEIQEGL